MEWLWLHRITQIPDIDPEVKHLDVEGNHLVTISSLPNHLISINCAMCDLITLSTSARLHCLICWGNNLTSLPSLSSKLVYLDVSRNQLTGLPELPSTLTDLVVDRNLISSLPTLPKGLRQLRCDYNRISTLPSLPDAMTHLTCYRNPIQHLPQLPSQIEWLRIPNRLGYSGMVIWEIQLDQWRQNRSAKIIQRVWTRFWYHPEGNNQARYAMYMSQYDQAEM